MRAWIMSWTAALSLISSALIAAQETPSSEVLLPPLVQQTSRERFEDDQRLGRSFVDRPAEEVLRHVAERLGMACEIPPDLKQRLARTVTLEDPRQWALEAAYAVAQKAEVGLETEGFPQPTLRATAANRVPRKFAGPFVVELRDLETLSPYPVGRVAVAVQAFGVPEGVCDLAHERFGCSAIVERVEGAGRDLLADPSQFRLSHVEGAIVQSRHVELRNLLRDVQRIDRLSGEVRVEIPTRAVTLTFRPDEVGQSKQAGPWSVKFHELRTADLGDAQASAHFFAKSDDPGAQLNVIQEAYDSQGKKTTCSAFGSDDGENVSLSVTACGPATAFVLCFVLESESAVYPFEFRDVKLPDASAMPEMVEPLDFGDRDAPVSLDFLSARPRPDNFVIDWTIKLGAMNWSNKPVRWVAYDVEYSGDRELAWHERSTVGELLEFERGEPNSPVRALLLPHEGREMDDDLLSAPDDWKPFQATVKSVGFFDGTRWPAQP